MSLQVFSAWLMGKSLDWMNSVNLGMWLWQRSLSTPLQIQTAPLHSSSPSSSSVRARAAPLPSFPLVRAQAGTTERRSGLKLSEDDYQALVTKLGYVDGDDLTALSDDDWTAVPPLQKKRILAAYAASVATSN